MGLFRRGARSVPDDAFPFFDADQAAAFRSLVRTAFAREGLEVSARADHVVDSGGRTFGLANVAAACHGDDQGQRAWPEVVGEHVHRIVRAVDAPSPFETWSPAEVLAATHLRLMATGDVADGMTGHARQIAPGLSEVLVLDLPESVLFFTDEEVERFGPVEDLRAAGRRNLRDVRADEHDVLDRRGVRIELLSGESVYTASTALLLPEVLARHGLAAAPDRGVFVALPSRHHLALHVLRDRSAVPSLQALVGMTRGMYEESVGSLSPDVYWWRPQGWEVLTTHEAGGTTVRVDSELGDVLDALSGD